MPVSYGSKEVDQVFFGAQEIAQIYAGTEEIWSNAKVVNLGSGTSWDIKKITSKYKNLTVDNFYYLSMTDVSITNSVTNVGAEQSYLAVMGWLSKTYDADTGSFNSSHFLTGSPTKTVNVTPVLVVDPSKLIDLGTAQTFDIKSKYPDDYKKFTVNNFIISRDKTGDKTKPNNPNEYIFNHFRGEPGTWSVTCTHKLEKSYNAETGILTCRIRSIANCDVSADSFNNTYNTHVYLVKKAL